jgi:LmbE family N-acetylglucosaminyl deacetylase
MSYDRSVRASLLALAVALGCAAVPAAIQPVPSPAEPAPLDLTLDRSTRLLVVAPHPDDETIGASGLLRRVVAAGGSVRVVLVTSGDGFPEGVEATGRIAHPRPSDFRGYGLRREGETQAAMALLGVAPASITFLGFPDEGICRLASTYLFDKRRAFESPYTNRASPPPTEQVIRGARYRGIDVRRELEQVVTTFGPTLIALPHPEDEHPDHCSTHIFVKEALAAAPAAQQRRIRVLHYLVHYGQWPLTAGAVDGTALRPPDGFPRGEGRWVSLALTEQEAALKMRALRAYTTQMQVIERLLLAFGRSNELFLEGEPASLPECWCDGDNVATEVPPSQYRRRPGRP